jgi:hypothetical protein
VHGARGQRQAGIHSHPPTCRILFSNALSASSSTLRKACAVRSLVARFCSAHTPSLEAKCSVDMRHFGRMRTFGGGVSLGGVRGSGGRGGECGPLGVEGNGVGWLEGCLGVGGGGGWRQVDERHWGRMRTI